MAVEASATMNFKAAPVVYQGLVSGMWEARADVTGDLSGGPLKLVIIEPTVTAVNRNRNYLVVSAEVQNDSSTATLTTTGYIRFKDKKATMTQGAWYKVKLVQGASFGYTFATTEAGDELGIALRKQGWQTAPQPPGDGQLSVNFLKFNDAQTHTWSLAAWGLYVDLDDDLTRLPTMGMLGLV